MSKKTILSAKKLPAFRLRHGIFLSFLILSVLLGLVFLEKKQEAHKNIRFEKSFNQTLSQAKIKDKRAFVVFSLPNCYPCENFLGQLESNPAISGFIERNFVSYIIDGKSSFTGGPELARKYKIEEFPAAIITDSEGELLCRLPIQLGQKRNAGIFLELLASFGEEKLSGKGAGEEAIRFQKKKEVGLLYRSAESWTEAMELVRVLKKNWKEDIWVIPDSRERYQVVIGTYENSKRARITKRFLKLWENEEVGLITLDPSGIRFYP